MGKTAVHGIQIKIDNLHFGYGKRPILENIVFEVEAGDFWGIIGPNGSGKSTLLRQMSNILTPDRGAVYINREDIAVLSPRQIAREIAVVPQETDIHFDFTVEEIVLMGRTPHQGRFQRETENDLQIVRSALRKTNTLDLADRPITQLSGGEKQRVIIARALAQKPKIMLLDEPTSHLDINYQAEIFELLTTLNREQKLTVVVISHDLNLAAQYCRQLLLLNEGQVYARGSPQEVITRENIESVYQTRVHIQPSPLTGRPCITLAGGQTENKKNNKHDQKIIHIIGGGGSAAPIMEDLIQAGHTVTAGVLNIGDSDWNTARSLKLEIVEAPPFSPIPKKAHEKNISLLSRADLVVVADFPIGPGNLWNLKAALHALRQGYPVVIIRRKENGHRRDYTGGKGEELFSRLRAGGAQICAQNQLIDRIESISHKEIQLQ